MLVAAGQGGGVGYGEYIVAALGASQRCRRRAKAALDAQERSLEMLGYDDSSVGIEEWEDDNRRHATEVEPFGTNMGAEVLKLVGKRKLGILRFNYLFSEGAGNGLLVVSKL